MRNIFSLSSVLTIAFTAIFFTGLLASRGKYSSSTSRQQEGPDGANLFIYHLPGLCVIAYKSIFSIETFNVSPSAHSTPFDSTCFLSLSLSLLVFQFGTCASRLSQLNMETQTFCRSSLLSGELCQVKFSSIKIPT